jgi:hypothetical protein
MIQAYISSREELQKFIQEAVENTVTNSLPEVIRRATRKKWITTNEVMEILQCTRRHIQYLRDSEQLPFIQNGRTIRYDVDEIERFLNNHKVQVLNQ